MFNLLKLFQHPNQIQDGTVPYAPMDEVPRGNIGPVFNEPAPMMREDNLIGQEDPISMMQKLYTPEREYADRYKDLLDRRPERNTPGIGRRIAAIFAGNPQQQEQFLYKPYINKMQDWDEEMKAVKPGLDLERYGNTNERTLANQTMVNDRLVKRNEEIAANNRRVDEDRDAAERGRNERAKTTAEIQRFRATHPNHVLTQDKEGNLIAFNPQDKSITYAADENGNKVKSSKMGDADKINLNFQHDLTKIEEQHQNRIEEQSHSGEVQKSLINERATARQTAAKTDKAMTVSADAAAYKLARQQHIADNPKNGKFWDATTGLPTSDAEDDDEYIGAVEDVRRRYNQIKTRSGAKPEQVVSPDKTKPTETSTQKRAAAIKYLQDAKKPVTEANIKYIMDRTR